MIEHPEETTAAYVLTHHWVPNFGANLQALATQQALRARGMQPQFADFRPEELVAKYHASIPDTQLQAHEAFVQEHLALSRRICDQASFEALTAEHPASLYVTGSDAVFRLLAGSTRADMQFPNPYWLVGIDAREQAARRVALAPSAMGADFSRLPKPVRAELLEALRKFDHVSARDSWTARQLKGLGFQGPVPIVPDPVFLLRDLIRAAPADADLNGPYIVVCTQKRKHRDWIQRFSAIANRAGFDTLAVPTPEGILDDGTTHRRDLPLSPLAWLNLLAGSSGYIGARFHPIVISLIAGAPVVALDMYHAHLLQRGRSKTWLLMKAFGLEHACHGVWSHRQITPDRAWKQIERQRGRKDQTLMIADDHTQRIAEYLDYSIGPCKDPSET